MKRTDAHPLAHTQTGFTIVELMIATVISSVLLLVITFGVVHFSDSYYKGINSSTTQATAQNAIDTISHAIQFSAAGTTPTDGTQTIFCAGTKVFLYTRGLELTSAPSSGNWGLYELDNNAAGCSQPPVTSGGTELLTDNMRLASINVSQVGATNVWQLEIRVAYGDPDLLCDTTVPTGNLGACSPLTAPSYGFSSHIQGDGVTCKLETGSQFCSIAELTTAVGQRITN